MAIHQSIFPGKLKPTHSIIFYDGECVFCTGGIGWIIRRLKEPVIHANSIENAVEQESSANGNLELKFMPLSACPTDIKTHFSKIAHPDSLWIWDRGVLYDQSDAAFFLLNRLAGWRFLAILGLLIPRAFRDACYRLVAQNRNRFFKNNHLDCPLPNAESK